MSVKILRQGLPSQSSGEDSVFPLQGTQVQSLGRELGSHGPCGAAKKKPNTHQATLKQGSVVSTPGAVGMELRRGPPLHLPRWVQTLHLESCTLSASERARNAASTSLHTFVGRSSSPHTRFLSVPSSHHVGGPATLLSPHFPIFHGLTLTKNDTLLTPGLGRRTSCSPLLFPHLKTCSGDAQQVSVMCIRGKMPRTLKTACIA